MALIDELTAEQLLQGEQEKDPRRYDLFNIILKNLKNNTNGQAVITNILRSSGITSSGASNQVVSQANYYLIQKTVSLRI